MPDGIALFRGIHAEFLYNREHPGGRRFEPRRLSGPPVVSMTLGQLVATSALHRAPNEVQALIRFNHDSPGETRTLNALRPVLLNCLPPEFSLPVSRHLMRALLAEAPYHFSRGNPAPGP